MAYLKIQVHSFLTLCYPSFDGHTANAGHNGEVYRNLYPKPFLCGYHTLGHLSVSI